MSLDDAIKTDVIEDLKNNSILILNEYAIINNETLTLLYKNKIIDDSLIEKVLEEAVFRQARVDYDKMIAKKRPNAIYADHAGMPEYLAYALDKGIFSKKEIEQIPFDHGYTAETFIKHYNREDLISNLRKNLLNPKPIPVLEYGCDLC